MIIYEEIKTLIIIAFNWKIGKYSIILNQLMEKLYFLIIIFPTIIKSKKFFKC